MDYVSLFAAFFSFLIAIGALYSAMISRYEIRHKDANALSLFLTTDDFGADRSPYILLNIKNDSGRTMYGVSVRFSERYMFQAFHDGENVPRRELLIDMLEPNENLWSEQFSLIIPGEFENNDAYEDAVIHEMRRISNDIATVTFTTGTGLRIKSKKKTYIRVWDNIRNSYGQEFTCRSAAAGAARRNPLAT